MPYELPQTDGRPIAILGAGVLGRRIATAFASAGYTVRIRDPDDEQRSAAIAYCKGNISRYSNILGTSKAHGSVGVFGDLEETVKSAWLVVECVPEQIETKIATFAELEKLASPDAILASNSSSFKSRDLLPGLSEEMTKERVLNMHFQMPPEANLVELMTCGSTSPEIFGFLSGILRQCGLYPVTAQAESTGFIFNRVWAAIKREVLSLLAEGVTDPETIDFIWKKRYNSPYGPCEQMDKTGLDTVLQIEKHYIQERGLSGEKTVDFLDREYVSKGRLGKKSEKGGFFPALSLSAGGSKVKDVPTLYFLDIGALAPDDPLHGGGIIAGRSDGTASERIIDRQSMPDGIDIDDGRIFWSNMGIPSENDGTVQSAKLDGSDIKTVLAAGVIHTPKQVTLDKKAKKLYVCDREGMRVMRCNYDGSDLDILWQTGEYTDPVAAADQTKHCVGICVDTVNSHVYWTQKGASKSNHGRIFRAPLDLPAGIDPAARQDVEVLFENLPEPIDLEIDPEGGHLYWTDRGELPTGNTINRVALSDIKSGPPSEHKHDILVRNLHEAIGLKLDTRNGHMYSTDIGGTVYRFNLDGTDRRKMFQELGAYTGIALVHG